MRNSAATMKTVEASSNAPSAAEPMLEATALTVRAGEVCLLAPTSFTVHPGGAIIVRGANGAGKSTLLRLLSGMTSPSTGTVRLRGSHVTERAAAFRRDVASMIGLPPMAQDLTVRDHVELVATSWYSAPGAAGRETARVLADLRLDHLRERFPHELSSGQTQLLGLALVLVRPADLLILDEPEQRLDAAHLAAIIDVLRRRQRDGAALVVATHSDALATALGGIELRLVATV